MPPPLAGLSTHRWLALQQIAAVQGTAGNGAAAEVLQMARSEAPAHAADGSAPTVQRVDIPVNFTEILQTDPASSSNRRGFEPRSFGQTSRYQLTRSGNQVNVLVRIRFMDPAGTAIPEDDVDRRDFGNEICRTLVGHWNGKFALVAPLEPAPGPATGGGAGAGGAAPGASGPTPAGAGVPVPGGVSETEAGPPAPTEARLNLHFKATPVWDLNADHDADVNLHAVPADPTADRPIDSGNWYGDMGTAYGDTPREAIYAHEYGHLLGIPDEYSLGHADMHLRLHAISGRGGEMGEQLDKAGRRQLILAALEPHMGRAIVRISGAAARAFRTQRGAIRAQLGDVLSTTWQSPAASASIMVALLPHLLSRPRLLAAVPGLVAEQARRLNYARLANQAVATQLSNGGVATLLESLYYQALYAAMEGGSTVTIPIPEGGSVEVRIDTQGVAGDAPLNRAARNAARAAVGTPRATAAGTRHRPAVYPSETFIGQLAAMAGQWDGVADLFATEAAALPGRIFTDAVGRAEASPPTATNQRRLRAEIRRLVTRMASGTARWSLDNFLSTQIRPMLDNQINQILSVAGVEAERHTSVPLRGGTDAAPAPPDPALETAVGAMAARAQSIQERPSGVGARGVLLRYTVNSMMGSTHAGTDIRPDNVQGIVDQVNAELRQAGEGSFEPRRGT